ncbi:MAG: hypothetical protein Q8N30_04065 [Methylococcales bacterium]|nr:hypothetical protein [Methylococcales bacterium]
MSIEDDILNNEFSGKQGTVIDGEVIYQKPKSRKLLIVSVGGLVLILGMVGLFYDDIKSLYSPKVESDVVAAKPTIKSAALPDDIVPGSLEVSEKGVASAADPSAIESKGVSIDTPSNSAASNIAVTVSQVNNLPADTTADPYKPNFAPTNKPKDAPITAITTEPNQNLSKEHFNELEQKIATQAALIEELSKKIDTLASEKSNEASKPRAEPKVKVVEKTKPFNKPEIVKSMKELHISALLSDGVMFDGDVAVAIGQYAKHLNGKILNINSEQNTITTDTKIYKVQ